MAVEWVRKNVSLMSNAEFCVEVLRKMDAAIADDLVAGETTCALAIVTSPARLHDLVCRGGHQWGTSHGATDELGYRALGDGHS